MEIQCTSSDFFFFSQNSSVHKEFCNQGTTLFIRVLDNLDPDSFQAKLSESLPFHRLTKGGFLTISVT